MSDTQPSGPGKFVVLEGMPFSGKTSFCDRVADYLRARTGRLSIVGHDPDGTGQTTPYLPLLVNYQRKDITLSPREAIVLYGLNRAQLSINITRHLAAGHNVIFDRWVLSTLVFQGVAESSDRCDLMESCEQHFPIANPDWVIVLDIDYPTYQIRRQLRTPQRACDVFTEARFEALRGYYLLVNNRDRGDYGPIILDEHRYGDVIDARRPPDQVWSSVEESLHDFLDICRTNEQEPECAKSCCGN